MSAVLPNPDTIDWSAPYRFADNLRITTPVAEARVSKRTRQHLSNMPREYRERLEREWMEAEAAVERASQPISDEIKARAAREWEEL